MHIVVAMLKRPAAAALAKGGPEGPLGHRARTSEGNGAPMPLDPLPELKVSTRVPTPKDLILGGAGIACLYQDVPHDTARATVEAAFAGGIEAVDTAPWYGAGLGEQRFGEFLATVPTSNAVTLSTKCGRLVKPRAEADPQKERVETHYTGHFITEAYHDNVVVGLYTADGVMESFRQSCARLRRDSFDILFLHDAEQADRFAEATASPGGGVEAMLQLRGDSKVRRIGLGLGCCKYALRFLRHYPKGTFDDLMLSNAWNLLDQDGLETLRECQRLGVRVHNVGIFASGFLWGGLHYRYSSEVPKAVVHRVERWRELAARHKIELPRLAMAFALLPEVVIRCGIGPASPGQVAGNLALCGGSPVPRAVWAEAKAAGLLGADVPIPSE